MSDEREAARVAFAEWAARQAGAPRGVDALVQDVEVAHDYAGLLTTEIQGRRVVWKTIPASSRARVGVPPISIAQIDPWNVDADLLGQRSDHIALCEACGGAKKLTCSVCRGSGKLLCGACGGQRKAYGYASDGSRRLLNCTGCRGKGEVDCSDCRRGIAACTTCGGEGRVQRWIEPEWWRRSVANVHPRTIAQQFGWGDDPVDAAFERDAELAFDVERPHRLTAADLGTVPMEWLRDLAPVLQPGERVARQRLRLVRVPKSIVHYRLGGDEDCVTLLGRRMQPPADATVTAFARRASNLRALLMLLLALVAACTLLSLGRGAFYWSRPTFLSLLALGAAAGAVYGAVADWTARRRHTHHWGVAAGSLLVVALAFAYAARPRLAHAQQLITSGNFAAAVTELWALGSDAPGRVWTDLRLAQIRGAATIDEARAALEKISPGTAQHALGVAGVDDLILATAAAQAREQRWPTAADTLALLSAGARGQRRTITTAKAVYVPLAKQRLAGRNWRGAAGTIAAARGAGIPPGDLKPLTASIRDAADDAIATARRERDPEQRLRLRLAAEEILMSWESASGSWGTPPLIALRTAVARDVAAAERAWRRRRSS